MLVMLLVFAPCRSDEQAFKRTDTAQRRAEMEKRAQERAEAEAQRLREQAASAWREERETKLNALHDLNLQVRTWAAGHAVYMTSWWLGPKSICLVVATSLWQ